MQIELTPLHVHIITTEAEAAARRLQRKLGLPEHERQDLTQDLLLDLLRRLPAFDPARGSLGAFAGIILRNQCARIAIRHHRQRRAQGGTMLSLDAPVAGGVTPLGCLLAESDGLAAWHGQDRTDAERAESHHDIARALGSLPEDTRQLCASLGTCSIAEIIRGSGVSRSALYRRIARLRLDLAMRGIGGRWDTSKAA